MHDLYGFVPDLDATLRTFAPMIIYQAALNDVELLGDDSDDCFKALLALPALIKKLSPRGIDGTIDYVYIETVCLFLC